MGPTHLQHARGRRVERDGSSQIGSEVYHELQRTLKSRGLGTSVGDEGGFAPALAAPWLRPQRCSERLQFEQQVKRIGRRTAPSGLPSAPGCSVSA